MTTREPPLSAQLPLTLDPGWYPVIYSWNANEGFFPGAGKWDGAEWAATGPVSNYWPHRFNSELEAKDFANTNDPEW